MVECIPPENQSKSKEIHERFRSTSAACFQRLSDANLQGLEKNRTFERKIHTPRGATRHCSRICACQKLVSSMQALLLWE